MFPRWKTVQLSLGRLWQKICTFRWAFPPPPHSHRWEEICVSCVWPTFHAKWPLDQAHSPSHDHQAFCNMDHRCAWAEQNSLYSGSDITVFCLPQCPRTCLKLGLNKGHSFTSGQSPSHWPLYRGNMKTKAATYPCTKQTIALDFFSYHLLLLLRTFFFF